jgi:membrane-associated phospholipid phosphatase
MLWPDDPEGMMVAREPTEQSSYGQNLVLAKVCFSALVVVLILAPVTGIQPDYRSFWHVGVALATICACFVYARQRGMTAVSTVCIYAIISTLINLTVLVYSYMTLRAALPLADDLFASIDAALGLSVPPFLRLVDDSPALSKLLEVAYQSFAFQLYLLPITLALLQRQSRARQMLVAQILIYVIACTVSIALPALGSFSRFGVDLSALQNLTGETLAFNGLRPGAAGYHDTLHAGRNSATFVLSLGLTTGVITFPSIHAALSVLCAWAAWPVRRLRWPLVALNAVMFVSAIPFGSHYTIDLIVGGLLAIATIAAVTGRWRAALPLTIPNFGHAATLSRATKRLAAKPR